MLAEKTLNILEENNITVYNRTEQDGKFYRDIEFYSNADEDVIETVWYDGTDSGFIKEVTMTYTFWDDVRKLCRGVTSDHAIGRWQCLAENRFKELTGDMEE